MQERNQYRYFLSFLCLVVIVFSFVVVIIFLFVCLFYVEKLICQNLWDCRDFFFFLVRNALVIPIREYIE